MYKLISVLLTCLFVSTASLAVPMPPVDSHGIDPFAMAQEGNIIVEVQNRPSENHYGNLYYRVGLVEGDRIKWGASRLFDEGYYPTLAISGNQIVLMHKALNSTKKLWSHVGEINPDKLTIQWSDAQYYQLGIYPTIATDGIGVFAFHEGYNLNNLYYQAGYLDMTNELITWGQ